MIPFALFIVLAAALGLVFGSFIGMASWRWPRKAAWGGRSACPHCSASLKWHQLVPVLSYVLQRGQCGACGHKISRRYPVIETLTAILFAGLAARYGMTGSFAVAAMGAAVLVMMIVIDAEHFILPNELVILTLVLGLVWRGVVEASWLSPLAGLGAGLLLFLTAFGAAYVVERMTEQESLGGGDVKLLFAAGPWVGIAALPVLLILSGLFGILTYLIWKKLDIKPQQSADVPFGAFPYGPAICLAIYTCVLLGDWVRF